MRFIACIVLAAMMAATALPAVGQQPAEPPPAAPEPSHKAAKAVPARHKAHRRHHARRAADDLCSIVNGWRAFPNRDPRGYFYTGRVCCCR
jgi:hypothetical protein